jgi:hypothetical protein
VVGAGRGRRWLLAGLAALVVTVGAGAAAPGVRAGPASTIVFSGSEAGVTVFSSGGGSSGQSIRVDFGPDRPPLPKKFVIEVPAGYTLDLTASPGTTIGAAAISIFGVDSPSFATGLGSLVAKDPNDSLLDPGAQACAPGPHVAVWAVSTSLAGQQLSLTIVADPSQEAGVGYVLQACPSGLATGDTNSVASISLLGIDRLLSPTAPGDYRWRALVTPQTRKAYELQALVPLPESVTLTARYDQKRKTAILTGAVVEGGRTVSRAHLVLTSSRNDSDLDIFETQTNAQGRFAFKAHVARTTDFTVSVAPSIGSCTGTSTAPAGCLGSTTIPPDDGFTTVWVSVPGGAARAIRAADQRRAEREGLAASDLPPGFETALGGGDACVNPKHESTLTITGESTSPAFYQLNERDSPSIIEALGLTRVYATARQARRAFEHQARVSTVRCELSGLGAKPLPIKPLRLPVVLARPRAFRAAIPIDAGVSANYDVIFLQRGRSVTLLRLVFLNAPDDLERHLTATLASRMH